jgi:hypothetical protein
MNHIVFGPSESQSISSISIKEEPESVGWELGICIDRTHRSKNIERTMKVLFDDVYVGRW